MGSREQVKKDRAAVASITKQLAELDGMTTGELAEKYQEVYGKPTRTHNKRYLIKRVSWKIQELAEGGLSDKALARIEELVPHFPERWQAVLQGKSAVPTAKTSILAPSRDPRLPPPGKVLTRVYKEMEHRVTVLDDGFEFQGDHHRTLSQIAKKITGTQWNGFTFFGLQRRIKSASPR